MADIYGKIIAVLPTRSGVSARGTQWSSQTAVIETQEQYPKKLAFDVLGDKINEFNLQVGEFATVSYDFDAREFNGRWFNSVRAWQVVKQQPTQGGIPPQQPMQQPAQPQGSSWGGAQAGAAAASAANRATNFPPPPPTGANAAPAGAAPSPDADNLPF